MKISFDLSWGNLKKFVKNKYKSFKNRKRNREIELINKQINDWFIAVVIPYMENTVIENKMARRVALKLKEYRCPSCHNLFKGSPYLSDTKEIECDKCIIDFKSIEKQEDSFRLCKTVSFEAPKEPNKFVDKKECPK